MRKDPNAFVKMLTLFLLFILCAVFCTTSLFAQQRKGRQDGGGPFMDGLHGSDIKRIPFPDYDSMPFDIAIGRLPSYYTGHNPELLYNNIKKERNTGKGGAVIAEQYPRGTRQGDAPPSTAALELNSTYAFLSKPTESAYNTREQTLYVYCEISIVSEDKREDETKRGFRVKYEPQMDNRYVYKDAFGKKIEVEEIKFKDYTVVFDNFREFPVERDMLPSVRQTIKKETKKDNAAISTDESLKRDIIKGSIALPKTAAEELRDMLRVLIVCTPAEPYITSSTIDMQGTPGNPRTYFAQHEYIHVRLLEIWFYDFETGKVLIKIRPKKSRA